MTRLQCWSRATKPDNHNRAEARPDDAHRNQNGTLITPEPAILMPKSNPDPDSAPETRAPSTKPNNQGCEPAATAVEAPHPASAARIPKSGSVVPPQWRADVGEVLITEAQLGQRVGELARIISKDYVGKDLVVVAVLTGTVMFLADLLRGLTLPLRLDFVGVSSYREGTVAGKLVFTKELRIEVLGRDVLLVDDILDSGQTLTKVTEAIRKLKPRSLRTCVLLDKPEGRAQASKADYTGFIVPNKFVVGYGLDYAERFRNLPFVGVLKPEVYSGSGSGPESEPDPAPTSHPPASPATSPEVQP